MNSQQQGPASSAGPLTGGATSQNGTGAMPTTLPGAGQMFAGQLQPQMMSLVSNPSMAAGAAQLFSHSAMLANPSAFLAMSEAFAAGMQQSAGQQMGSANQAQMMMPQFANMMGTAQPMATAQSNAYGGNVAGGMTNSQPAPTTLMQPTMTNQNNGGAQSVVLAAPTASLQSQLSSMAGSQMHSLPPLPPPQNTTNNTTQLHATTSAPVASAPSKSSSLDGVQTINGSRGRKGDLSADEKAKQNRDRNREHARSTRLRKKAYVQKLKELVEGLHAERSEEMRKRRVAMQHLAEVQSVRRAVVNSFLQFHSEYESDQRKWGTILEDTFWFKQPITPYRSFRRGEIEQECRVSRGVDAMIADAASMSVMVEGIGSRSARWMQIKREELLQIEEKRSGGRPMPRSIARQDSRLQHAVSSLSSSSGSSNGSGPGALRKRHKLAQPQQATLNPNHDASAQAGGGNGAMESNKVSSSSSSNGSSGNKQSSNDFHDYHAQPLPDPKLGEMDGSSPSSDDSPEESQHSSNNGGGNKHVSTDSSSSGDDSGAAIAGPTKRRKMEHDDPTSAGGAAFAVQRGNLPPNIAKEGGIVHSIRATDSVAAAKGHSRLSLAPAITLPPFMGIGKRPALSAGAATAVVGAALVVPMAKHPEVHQSQAPAPAVQASVIPMDADTSSCHSSQQSPQIKAYYHINEDDMIMMEDVLMCPFMLRSQDAVQCGALAECVMPGMLRAHFSQRNKLLSLEMLFDSMGFMQQLERASGSEGTAQIVPASLEMALSPNGNEARVITLAKEPFLIVSVTEAWTRCTKYTQMEVEGKGLNVLEGPRTNPETRVRVGKPVHRFDEVALGRCACSTNIFYDKDGREFIAFVCSYPLTNSSDEITHLLHEYKELPVPTSPTHELSDSSN